MSDLLGGLVKGLSGFLPQDDPNIRIFNLNGSLKDLAEKEEKVFARLGRQVYGDGGSEAYPEYKNELDALKAERQRTESELTAAKEAKAALDTPQVICSNCGCSNPEGAGFCRECGGRLTVTQPSASRFCPSCGTPVSADSRFCSSCGSEMRL